MAATGNLFIGPNGQPLGFTAAVIGGRSVGTPGLLRMLELAHAEKGRLPWAVLFQPAITLAENGFALSPRALLGACRRECGAGQRSGDRPLLLQRGQVPEGRRNDHQQSGVCATLRTIAAGGAQAFYTGPIAQDIVNKVKSHPTNPGLLELGDLAAYQAKKRSAVCGIYRFWEICGTNSPSSGGIDGPDDARHPGEFRRRRALAPESVAAVHLISEAYRLAYADRAVYMGGRGLHLRADQRAARPQLSRGARATHQPHRSMGVPVRRIRRRVRQSGARRAAGGFRERHEPHVDRRCARATRCR